MALNYGTVVKGGVDGWDVQLEDSGGWDVAAETWTWKMLLAKKTTPTVLAVAITSSSSTRSGSGDIYMDLVFALTQSDSDTLAAEAHFIEIEGTEGNDTEHYYHPAMGELIVRLPYAGG